MLPGPQLQGNVWRRVCLLKLNFVHPSWNPSVLKRETSISFVMTCGQNGRMSGDTGSSANASEYPHEHLE
jgi:hypothetical protein